jgi:hypothetical protein
MKPAKSLITVVAAATWLLAIGIGVRVLTGYESAPGDAGAPPKKWPAESRIQLATDRATLVMLAHPHCPCTAASVDELARVMARVQGKANAYVLFLKPEGSADDWEKTGLWQRAASIPGVTVLSDADGREAHRFNIETSGHTLLFDAAGDLWFSGGITASRGHSGDNAGESAIISLLTSGVVERSKTLVFGCSLFDSKKQLSATACSK